MSSHTHVKTRTDSTSIDFMLERKIGNKGHGEGKWPAVEAWLKRTKEVEAYKRAVSKTGHTLHGNFKQ